MADNFIFKVYNDNLVLVNSFEVKEKECNRLIDTIQKTYFTPTGPFEMPFEEILVNMANGQTGSFNLAPYSIVKYYEKGSDSTGINFVRAKVNLESDK